MLHKHKHIYLYTEQLRNLKIFITKYALYFYLHEAIKSFRNTGLEAGWKDG